jgi:hypothetical protein
MTADKSWRPPPRRPLVELLGRWLASGASWPRPRPRVGWRCALAVSRCPVGCVPVRCPESVRLSDPYRQRSGGVRSLDNWSNSGTVAALCPVGAES